MIDNNVSGKYLGFVRKPQNIATREERSLIRDGTWTHTNLELQVFFLLDVLVYDALFAAFLGCVLAVFMQLAVDDLHPLLVML